MIVDLHADSPMWMQWGGYDFCKAHRPLPGGAFFSNVDLPRMQQAGLTLQVFGMVALPSEGDPFGTILSMIDRVRGAQDRSNGALHIVQNTSEMTGKQHVMLSIEGVHPLRGDISRADTLIDHGVVSFGLSHFHRNEACCPAIGWGADDAAGLTEFGHNLVEHLTERSRLVDLTHINERGFWDALEHCKNNVFVSHTGAYGAYPVKRNIPDNHVRAIADRGGVLGVIFARMFLGGDDLDAVVKHVEHLIRMGGEGCVSLGSDFDGMIVPVKGLRDVTGLVALREVLTKRLGSTAADAVMGKNAERLLRATLG